MVTLSIRDEREYLHEQLREVRSVMLWKLEGLSECDKRRPMTPTGTNLLGLVKHLIGMEANYLGETFGRPFDQPLPWYDNGGGWRNADMWATAEESTDYIVGLYRAACLNADRTIDDLDLDAPGITTHAGEATNLRCCLISMIVETARHAGHADIAPVTHRRLGRRGAGRTIDASGGRPELVARLRGNRRRSSSAG